MKDPDIPKKSGNDFVLEDVPLGLKFLKRRKLEEEAKKMFDALVTFHGSAHISRFGGYVSTTFSCRKFSKVPFSH